LSDECEDDNSNEEHVFENTSEDIELILTKQSSIDLIE
jgi:hypothetical protein